MASAETQTKLGIHAEVTCIQSKDYINTFMPLSFLLFFSSFLFSFCFSVITFFSLRDLVIWVEGNFLKLHAFRSQNRKEMYH